jgi:N-acyl-D-aspartate/D-glutamate deacylase
VGLSYPDVIRGRTSFLSGGFDGIPGWAPVMALAEPEKLVALDDPAVRASLREGLDTAVGRVRRLDAMVVTDSRTRPELVGRVVGDVVAEEGAELVDLLCDLAVADGLRTMFASAPMADDADAWAAREATWSDDRVVIGASDAGAHLDILATFDYPVRYLALQRRRGVVPLERVVQQLSSVPARLYGLADRGVLAPGAWADVVVFDAEAVGPGAVEWRDDLPGGAGRLFAQPRGVARVIVNGTDVVVDGRITGDVPGQVLRRGVPAG